MKSSLQYMIDRGGSILMHVFPRMFFFSSFISSFSVEIGKLKFLRISYVAYQVLSSNLLLHRHCSWSEQIFIFIVLQIRSHSFSSLGRFHHDEDLSVHTSAPVPWRQWLSVHVQVETANASECGARSCH